MVANKFGKLGEMVVANMLQRQTHLFHNLQYGSRIQRSATDMRMIIASTAQKEIKKGNVTLLGKDVVSVFNNIRTSRLLEILTTTNW